MNIWDFPIDERLLSEREVEYLKKLPSDIPTVQWVWNEMDRVWDELGLNNRVPLAKQPVDEFYSHPVWLMNGIFTGTDEISQKHREAIARFLKIEGKKSVVDIGGGFGQLARAIRNRSPDVKVTVWDPYPSPIAVDAFSNDEHVEFVASPAGRVFDVVISQDVLEHLEDPIGLAYEMAQSCKKGGLLIFANCFHSVIKCHLPRTFHLRHTFPLVMKAMGVDYIGRVEGAEHAQAFRRSGVLNLDKARRAERICRVGGPILNSAIKVAVKLKQCLPLS